MNDYMKGYDRLIESKKIVDQMEAEKLEALILRKQAEAVESLKDFECIEFGTTGVAIDVVIILKEADRLRQQADELEK